MGTTTTWARDQACTAPQCWTGTWVTDLNHLTTQHSQSHSHRGFNLAMTLPRLTGIYHPPSVLSPFGAFSMKRDRTKNIKITIPNITMGSPIVMRQSSGSDASIPRRLGRQHYCDRHVWPHGAHQTPQHRGSGEQQNTMNQKSVAMFYLMLTNAINVRLTQKIFLSANHISQFKKV